MQIHIQNRQKSVKVSLAWLRSFAEAALPKCSLHSPDGRFALARLREIEVAIVSDRVIARVHQQFMGIPGPTDVITFEHGEIVMSAETARTQAADYGKAVDVELGLYLVHGLLHLNGWEDSRRDDAIRMQKTQNRIMKACLERTPAP